MKRLASILLCLIVLIGCVHQNNVSNENDTESQTMPGSAAPETLDLTELWAYGLISIRTGEPLIEEGHEHKLDESLISYGYNLVVDKEGNILPPRGAPLQGGEQLILTDQYQNDHNMREYARIFTIMAPIRDILLYHFEVTSREEWLKITEILTINDIKTQDAAEINGRSILSTEQVYDYIASGYAEGSPVMRYELKLEEKGIGSNHMSEKYQIVYVDEPEQSAWGIIGRGVSSYNKQQAGDNKFERLCFVLHVPDQEIVGGVIGEVYWEWFYVDLLWVREELRGRGYGHQLLTMAEDEARRRGAKNAYLDTFSFQAPDFYKQHGYQVFGELDEFPPGHQRYFLRKQL